MGEIETASSTRFIALHGRGGEDGSIQGVLETLRIPYTGSGVQASAIAIDKVFTKRIWETHKLPTPRYRVIHSADRAHLNEVADELRLPLVVKPPNEGSTIGISRVRGYSGMGEAFKLARQYDDVVLAEEFIDGQELTCAILGQGSQAEALPLVEIRAPDANYDYHNSLCAKRVLMSGADRCGVERNDSQSSVRAYTRSARAGGADRHHAESPQ